MCGNYGDEEKWQKQWQRERDRQISAEFNKFAGKQVNPADPNDPVLEEMRKEARNLYSRLQLVPAGKTITRDNGGPIVSAELIANKDGSWRIGSRFRQVI